MTELPGNQKDEVPVTLLLSPHPDRGDGLRAQVTVASAWAW